MTRTLWWRRAARGGAAVASALVLANCSGASTKLGRQVDPKYGVSPSPRVVEPGQPIPKGGGAYRVGKPYVVAGRTYYPQENPRYRSVGTASWYGDDFHGRLTANGEVYDMNSLSAAHPTMPMPSYARVTNMRDGTSIIVRVNDRGPYHNNRIIDLSKKAAEVLNYRKHGLVQVKVEYVGPAPLEGSDDRMLLATLRQGSPAPAPSRVMLAAAKQIDIKERTESRQDGRPDSRQVALALPEPKPAKRTSEAVAAASSADLARQALDRQGLRLRASIDARGDDDDNVGNVKKPKARPMMQERGLY